MAEEKRVLIVMTYEAYVPADMDLGDIEAEAESEFPDTNGFRLKIDSYPDEDLAEPLFELTDVSAGRALNMRIRGEAPNDWESHIHFASPAEEKEVPNG